MIRLDQSYARSDFIDFLQKTFLKDFVRDVRPVSTPGFQAITKATTLGRSDNLDLQIFEFEYTGSANKRVTLTKEAFQIMKQSATFNALAVFYGQGSDDWRLSFLTANPQRSEKGKVTVAYSNPRRYSFFLGPNAKVNTPTKFIISQGVVKDSDDLKSRFSLEVVNKDFYKEISKAFTELSNGLLKLPFVQDKSQTHLEFAVRLIGRIIFCWFLREKKSETGLSLMPHQILSLDAVLSNKDYYHQILEPIFFEVLNKPIKLRKDDFAKEPFSSVPYLNGGLFSPQEDDYYKRNNGDLQSQFHNTLVIPDAWFKNFFETLETYNFTIDENTSFDEELSIDPEMLGRIFENLLAEINPETGESARKSTGSYYTPRTIVNYMVDESLVLYLKEKTKIEEDKLRAIVSYDLTDDSEYPLTSEESEKITEALEKIKILDPACGSGAFPIGALQKIVFVLQQVDPDGRIWFKKQIESTPPEVKRVLEREFSHKNFDYIRKLGIIRENIYGIDIQSIATEISRLRCFLTLVVDERIQDDADNRGLEPLPNLDFKFVTANSLIGLPTSLTANQMGLFEDDLGIKELKGLRDMFFNATGVERDQLKLQFVQAQNRMFQRMIEEGRKGYADLTTKLSSWDPFSHKTSSWFDPEWMFGIKDGYDIVIANPPYIGEKYHKDLFDETKRSILGKFYNGQMDYFYFFFHFALNLNKDYGITSFISTNYYPTARGAKKLRKDFKDRATIVNLSNFNELKIFESAKGQHNMITILQKHLDKDFVAKTCVTHRQGVAKPDILQQILSGTDPKTEYYEVKQKDLFDGDENYIRLTGIGHDSKDPLNSILNKIKSIGEQLGSLCNVNVGLYTGADKVTNGYLEKYELNANKGEGIFILTKEELSKLTLNDFEKSRIVPFYKNSDISKWCTKNQPTLFLVNLSYPDAKNIQFSEIPNLYKHVSKYEMVLKGRKSNDNGLRAVIKSGYWWTFTIRQLDFSQPKIVSPQRSPVNTFGYNETSWYASADVYYITQRNNDISLKYVLALLNSKLYYLWLYNRGKRKGESLELYQKPLSEIPIKNIPLSDQKPFIDATDAIIQLATFDNENDPTTKGKIKEKEKVIDQMIYELYGLTEDEVKIVENNND